MSIIICPNCKSTLDQLDKTFRCQNNHSFDLLKEGYINLLLANQKSKPNPGDNKIMINARDAFLATGHYDFLLDNIESAVNTLDSFALPKTETSYLLDLGCGTGYYARNLFKQNDLEKIGIDISKQAIAKASKRDKDSTYIVGSAYDLPNEENAVDVVLNIFSPIHLEEAVRVLKPGGIIIKVIPGSDHMKEVAAMVYEKIIPHRSSIKKELEVHVAIEVIKRLDIEKVISLADQDLHDFITMTPYLYKFGEGVLEQLKELAVTISFQIIIARHR